MCSLYSLGITILKDTKSEQHTLKLVENKSKYDGQNIFNKLLTLRIRFPGEIC